MPKAQKPVIVVCIVDGKRYLVTFRGEMATNVEVSFDRRSKWGLHPVPVYRRVNPGETFRKAVSAACMERNRLG